MRFASRGMPLKGMRAVAWLLVFGLSPASPAMSQQKLVDDAHRTVTLPVEIRRVFAAGAPAEVLLYTLVPEKLVGRNHLPAEAALEFMPPEFRHPVRVMRLPDPDDTRNDEELLALKPDVYIDYGDVNADYIRAVSNVQQRTGIPAMLLDGGLERIPDIYRKLGRVLGVSDRGKRLAAEVDGMLAKYRGVLRKAAQAPRAYIACSADGRIPCLDGDRSGEVAAFLGAINVAGTRDTAPARPVTLDDMKAWNPEVIIAGNEAAAARIRSDEAWQSIRAVAEHRVYAPPALPFAWGPRPPSVNRLMGLIWLAYVLPGRPFDGAFFNDMRNFFAAFYHVSLSDEQMRRLLGMEAEATSRQ